LAAAAAVPVLRLGVPRAMVRLDPVMVSVEGVPVRPKVVAAVA
jgi:hypothetical protein